MQEPSLTPEDIAEYLKVQPQTVWRMIRRGDLPAMKIGRVYRVRQEDFDRWCQERLDAQQRKGNATG